MAIPTIVLGAPAALTPASMAGLNNSARPTTVMSERISNMPLIEVFRLLGLSCVFLRVPQPWVWAPLLGCVLPLCAWHFIWRQ